MAAFFSQDWVLCKIDNDEPIEIDRDPAAFEIVLSFVQGTYDVYQDCGCEDPIFCEMLKEELEFWGLLQSDDPNLEQCFAQMSIRED